MGCGNKRLMFCYCPILNMCIALSEQAYSLDIFSSLLFLSLMWNTVLVFFIWNENISSSQIAQAIWSAFRWQGITKAADMGQIQTCGVQLEKTSCPCYQSPEITSYSPSSSKEIGLIVLEINPSLLTEARRQQGCAWGHQCGCSAERAPASSWAVTLLCGGLGPAEIGLALGTQQELRSTSGSCRHSFPVALLSTLLHELPGQLIRDSLSPWQGWFPAAPFHLCLWSWECIFLGSAGKQGLHLGTTFPHDHILPHFLVQSRALPHLACSLPAVSLKNEIQWILITVFAVPHLIFRPAVTPPDIMCKPKPKWWYS